jgi:hypothetical protein
MTHGWSGLDLAMDQLVLQSRLTLEPRPQPLRDELGADHGHLARGIDAQPDLAPFKTDDGYTNVVSNEEFFHQLSSQHQHGTLPLSTPESVPTSDGLAFSQPQKPRH